MEIFTHTTHTTTTQWRIQDFRKGGVVIKGGGGGNRQRFLTISWWKHYTQNCMRAETEIAWK